MFDFPANTIVDRKVAKSRFHQNLKLNTRLKNLLADQIQEIRWLAKLSPETTNLPATPSVLEIAIFRLILKADTLSPDILTLIDKAIPYPIIFEIRDQLQHRQRYAAAYKRPSEANSKEWVTSSHTLTDWQPVPDAQSSTPLPPLPPAINLEQLYAAILKQILPIPPRDGEALPEYIFRCDSWLAKQREIAKLSSRIHREKQFNRKVTLNSKLNALKQEVEQIEANH